MTFRLLSLLRALTKPLAPLRGAVSGCAFLGECTRLTIDHAAPDALVIDAPGRIELAHGTAVSIAIAADGLFALGA